MSATMPTALVVAVILLAACLVWRLYGAGGGRRCRWRRDPTHKTGGAQRYVCRRCGVDAFTRDGGPPQNCLREARSAV